MTKTKTKAGAETILLVAQNLLRDGRPRKPLGQPRPKQAGGKMSLPAALKEAQKMVGATRAQYRAALEAIDFIVYPDVSYMLGWNSTPYQTVTKYDEVELDTRHIVRTLSKAIKSLA